MNRRAAVILLLACMLLSAACAPAAPAATTGAEATQSSSQPTGLPAPATAAPNLPSAWQTHTDPELGYSLSYPEDIEFTWGTSKAGIYTARLQFRVPGVDGYQGMVLRVEPNPERRGIEQVAEELYRRNLLAEPPANWLQELGSINVAGLSGVQMGEGGDFSLVVPYEDHVYIIAPVHDTATTALDPQALALFHQILATLRIAP